MKRNPQSDFNGLGRCTKARWMAKLLYSLKLALMDQRITALPRGAITTTQQTQKVRYLPGVRLVRHAYIRDVVADVRQSSGRRLE